MPLRPGTVDGGQNGAQRSQIDVVGQTDAPVLLAVPGILQQDGEKDWVYSVLCNGKELYNGESIARGSHLVLVVGNGNKPVRKESVIDEDYFE